MSSLGQKNGRQRIWMSSCFYSNIIDREVENNKDAKSWFTKSSLEPYESYSCDVVKTDMNAWINEGMN